ncbi:MAG TPA: glycerol kinase [Caldithrix abyssi]|uniref:Glycerol kinase n=1 Tax=Caldithrix abyssi TaxID=187145 RepID=A0A7V4U579_CALAY|nr:glycerol kinase [Caldithrix abyssi]
MYILSIDQGTTGTTTILYDAQGRVAAKAYRPFRQIYPQPGWVEHDPMDIWQTVVDTVGEILQKNPFQIDAVGITNQRETTVVWDAESGKPVYNAIVWQCRRTADICNTLQYAAGDIKAKTGLPLDAYFSGTKIKWILENVSGLNTNALRFGTIDTWLIWQLTGGKVHATDFTNASRTLLFNIHSRQWDRDLCRLLNVPHSLLPEVRPSADHYGTVQSIPALKDVPILGVSGDQQAALFGQRCFEDGEVKNTYGTGCFMLMNTGQHAVESREGLLTTIAVNGQGQPCYALEGSVFIAGAAIQWLRDELKILDDAAESEQAALSLKDNGGVYLVPAFTGLGAPHWDMEARGTIVGLTRGSNRNHLIRAALEAMAYQTYDVLKTMEKDAGLTLKELKVDGGATANRFLMQFQSDLLNIPILKPHMAETTALGAAYLAGLKAGIWPDKNALRGLQREEETFLPKMDNGARQDLLAGWQKALRQALTK